MNKIAGAIGEKVGDMVEGAVKNALGFDDKSKNKNKNKEKGGGIFSFGKDKKKEEEKDKGGLFSFGGNKKDKEGGGLFSRGDDDQTDKQKKSGFAGLFAEGQAGGADGGGEGPMMGGEGEEACGGFQGQSVAVTGGDLLDDLREAADEMSKGN